MCIPTPSSHAPVLPAHLPTHLLTSPHISPPVSREVPDGTGLAIDGGYENSATAAGPRWPCAFANHSCRPNCRLEHWPEEGEEPDRLVLLASEDVPAGAELRFDYESGASHVHVHMHVHCACGMRACACASCVHVHVCMCACVNVHVQVHVHRI